MKSQIGFSEEDIREYEKSAIIQKSIEVIRDKASK